MTDSGACLWKGLRADATLSAVSPHAKSVFRARTHLLLVLIGVTAGLTGCASQGALQPPSLHLPAAVEHLSAERYGDAVELHWTTPLRTTDGVALETAHHYAGPYAAEICRSALPFPAGVCTPMTRIPVVAGKPGTYRDVLMAPWSAGAPGVMLYRVRVVNAKGRGAEGAEIAVASGAAVPPITGLLAAPAAGGVALRWQPLQGSAGDRVLLRVVRGNSARTETLAVEPTLNDPGGADDAGARVGVEQSYTAFRSRTVTIGKQQLTLNSAQATVSVAASALPPPPAAPVGLEAVVNTLGASEIDLVWQASDEAGVTGYLVYRAEDNGTPTAITPQPIHAFSYSDSAVRAGVRYRYRVAAVNANGAGPMSAEIERTVAAP
jgi:hypothetical protein